MVKKSARRTRHTHSMWLANGQFRGDSEAKLLEPVAKARARCEDRGWPGATLHRKNRTAACLSARGFCHARLDRRAFSDSDMTLLPRILID